MSERRRPEPAAAPVGGPARGRASALDRPGARVAAFAVFLAVLAALAWIHRDDLFPPEEARRAADDPVARCLAERLGDVEQMRAEGVIDEAQAAQFSARARAFCQDRFGPGAGPPPPSQY